MRYAASLLRAASHGVLSSNQLRVHGGTQQLRGGFIFLQWIRLLSAFAPALLTTFCTTLHLSGSLMR